MMKAFHHKMLLEVAMLVLLFSLVSQHVQAYGVVRAKTIQGEVQIQKIYESSYEPLRQNMPILEGDRIWTGKMSRAELQTESGTNLRLDYSTEVEFTSVGEGSESSYQGASVVRIWGGAFYLDSTSSVAGNEQIEIETPSASMTLLARGLYRIDLDGDGDTRITVYDGAAEVSGREGSVIVRNGERTFVYIGYAPDQPFYFNQYRSDSFDDWNDSMISRSQEFKVEEYEELPEELSAHYGELDAYGDWQYSDTYDSTVWVPYVQSDWRPYYNGYWASRSCGLTWVSYEPWGWIPYHYGRWGYSISLGWHWVPGTCWSPGWVSWYSGPSYWAWAPIDYWGYPCYTYYPRNSCRGGICSPYYSRGHGRRKYYIDPHSYTAVPHANLLQKDIKKFAYGREEIAHLNPAKKININSLNFSDRGGHQNSSILAKAKTAYSSGGGEEGLWIPSKYNGLTDHQKHAHAYGTQDIGLDGTRGSARKTFSGSGPDQSGKLTPRSGDLQFKSPQGLTSGRKSGSPNRQKAPSSTNQKPAFNTQAKGKSARSPSTDGPNVPRPSQKTFQRGPVHRPMTTPQTNATDGGKTRGSVNKNGRSFDRKALPRTMTPQTPQAPGRKSNRSFDRDSGTLRNQPVAAPMTPRGQSSSRRSNRSFDRKQSSYNQKPVARPTAEGRDSRRFNAPAPRPPSREMRSKPSTGHSSVLRRMYESKPKPSYSSGTRFQSNRQRSSRPSTMTPSPRPGSNSRSVESGNRSRAPSPKAANPGKGRSSSGRSGSSGKRANKR
ncbi:DUF6600 domain-containing protein [Acidobacteriota bacterium]